jgi:uncharacterized protein
VEFEWDDVKAALNKKKHGIAFRLATEVFFDENRLEEEDTRKFYGEPRWSVTGIVDGIELTVTHTVRENRIRLITARKATRHEREDYWKDC